MEHVIGMASVANESLELTEFDVFHEQNELKNFFIEYIL